MLPTTFAKYIRLKTKTDTTTFDDTDMVVYANVLKDEIAAEIIKKDENYFGLYSLADLKAGQREYAMPEDLLCKILFIEAKLDGTKWERLDEVNINMDEYVMDETSIQADFALKKPSYFIFRGSVYILNGSAITDVTDGIRLWSHSYPEDFTTFATGSNDMSVPSTSTTHGWPRPFQELLARRIVIEWKNSQDKPIPLTEREQKYDVDLQSALDSISSMNKDRSLTASVPYNDGSTY